MTQASSKILNLIKKRSRLIEAVNEVHDMLTNKMFHRKLLPTGKYADRNPIDEIAGAAGGTENLSLVSQALENDCTAIREYLAQFSEANDSIQELVRLRQEIRLTLDLVEKLKACPGLDIVNELKAMLISDWEKFKV